MRVLLDINAYSALRRGDSFVAEKVRRSEKVLLSVIVAGELLSGFRNGSRYEENSRALQTFREDSSVLLLPITWTTAELFGRISSALRKRGTPIPTNDIWLGGHAMEADAGLLSSDGHFKNVDGLNWLAFSAG